MSNRNAVWDRSHWLVVERLSRYEAAVQFILLGDQVRLLESVDRPAPDETLYYMTALRRRLDQPQ